jgi:hypothetical protein
MHGRKKEWVIDVDGSSLRDAERAAALERARRFADHASESTASTEEGYYVLGPVPDRTRMLLLLTYALGPAAPVLTQTGRRQIVWAVLGLLGVPLWVGMLWKWPVLSGWLAAGRVPLLPWLLVSALLFCLTFAAWSRSVFLTGWDARFFAERLPSWLQNPAIVGLLGLVAPGAGLLVSAAPRRAAIAVGNAGLTLLAAAIVVSAPLLWKCNQLTSSGAIPPRALEMLFIAAFAATIVGSLMWFTHALDGARLATYRSGRRTHRRGDWFAVAVLAALVTFFVTFEPRSLAHDLDRHAQSIHAAGLHYVPLPIGLLVTHLDAARPSYGLHVAGYYDALGKKEQALRIRTDLRARWQEYANLTALAVSDPWVPLFLPVSVLPGAPRSEIESLAGVGLEKRSAP